MLGNNPGLTHLDPEVAKGPTKKTEIQQRADEVTQAIGKEMRAEIKVNRVLDVKRPKGTNLAVAAKQADERIRAE